MGSNEEDLAIEGREHTNALGQSLQSPGLQQIYSSPLRRALETSEIIGQLLRVHIIL